MFKFVVLAVLVALAHADHINKDAQIRSQTGDITPEGQYAFSYETSNGIAAQEQGLGGVNAAGSVTHVSPEGVTIQLTYTADENGFHPAGAHLPVAPVGPPIPEAILRSLAWIAAHPQKEEVYVQRKF